MAGGGGIRVDHPVNSVLGPDGSNLLIRFAAITAASQNNNEIVAAVAGKKIRVLAYNYVSAGTTNVAWRSGATTVIGGLGYWVANTGKVVSFSPIGWFETAAGEALNAHLSAAVAIGGECVYVLI